MVVARGDMTGGLGRVCGHGEKLVFFLSELRAIKGCRQRKDLVLSGSLWVHMEKSLLVGRGGNRVESRLLP